MTVDQAVDLYQRRLAARTLALEAMKAVQSIAGLVSPETVQDVKRAFRTAEMELNACTGDNAVKPLLKQALAAGIALR
jgi:hypothetical protein